MSKETKEQIIKRVKSFLWRLGAVLVAAALAFVAQELEMLELSPEATVVVGLVVAEITKFLNQK